MAKTPTYRDPTKRKRASEEYGGDRLRRRYRSAAKTRKAAKRK